METCKTCELIARRDANLAPPWDCIYRAHYWDVVHHNSTTLPGWLVVVARRHIAAIDELTDDEAAQLGILLRRVSLALKETTGCLWTYVVQFAELPGHRHVHFHVIPRMAGQPENRRGANVMGYASASEEERVSPEQMNAIAMQVQAILRPAPNPDRDNA